MITVTRRHLVVFTVVCATILPTLSSFDACLAEDSIKADLCVIEATPGGVACAVRAAREGLDVVLVNRTQHLGGILSSGLGVWDTLWEGRRSPLYDELRQQIFDFYRSTFGERSSQYRHCLPGKSGHSNGLFEPRVVEALITQMVAAEKNITVVKGYVPVEVSREERRLESITIERFGGEKRRTIYADAFADCSYEGDVLPLAEVAYRVGRESRDELNEPHAGRIFLKSSRERPEHIDAAQHEIHTSLALRQFAGFQEIVVPESTGEGDGKVQAFNYRTILTSEPENRLPVEKPANYDPEFLKTLEYGSVVHPIPNQKIGWNRPQLVGLHQDYVEGDWSARQRVMDAHWNAAMGLLWFLQNDESVPEKKRKYWQEYGLARDEFRDNDHRPYEIYVREARRLDGRYLVSQHDLMPLSASVARPTVHADAVAFIDWYADSHAVSGRGNGVRGSLDEGKMMLHAETWPGQIPWRSLLPKEVDNLVVPVCLSASHVAWGAIRLEPTWMQTGEAAGFAVALAKQQKTTPGELDADLLVRHLAMNDFLLTFFNDADPADREAMPAVVAAEYFGTRGFLPGFDARLDQEVSMAIVEVWNSGFNQMLAGKLDGNEFAARVAAAEAKIEREEDADTLSLTRGQFMLDLWSRGAAP